jgi:hypothetical protein
MYGRSWCHFALNITKSGTCEKIKELVYDTRSLHVYPVLVTFIFFGGSSRLCQASGGISISTVLAMLMLMGDSWMGSLSARLWMKRGPSSALSTGKKCSATTVPTLYKSDRLACWWNPPVLRSLAIDLSNTVNLLN